MTILACLRGDDQGAIPHFYLISFACQCFTIHPARHKNEGLRQYALHDLAVDVRESVIAALEALGEAGGMTRSHELGLLRIGAAVHHLPFELRQMLLHRIIDTHLALIDEDHECCRRDRL